MALGVSTREVVSVVEMRGKTTGLTGIHDSKFAVRHKRYLKF
jgi:hypothetical protein